MAHSRDIDQAFAELRAILAAERLERERQTRLVGFRAAGAGGVVMGDKRWLCSGKNS